MKMKPYTIVSIALFSLPMVCTAENGGGTGEVQPSIQLNISADQRAVLSLSDGQQLVVGSGVLNQGYSELSLDAFSAQQNQSHWGYAEVLLGCHQADVIVHQVVDGQWLEVVATQVVIPACHQ